jgi:hypothetical protein
MVATLVATTDISKPTGPDGNPVEQPIEFSTGLSSHPGKFDVVYKPRSEKALQLLEDYVGERD